MADTYRDAVLALAPTIYLPLDEAAGATCLDASGNGFNGTMHGTYTRGIPAPVGSRGTATFFDGSSAYMQNGARFTTQHILTIVFWLFVVTYDSTQRWAFTLGDPNTLGPGAYWKVDTSGGTQRIGLGKGDGVTYEEVDIARAPNSVWSMFAAVLNTQAAATADQVIPFMQGNLATKTIQLTGAIGTTWQSRDWYLMADGFNNRFFVGGYAKDVAVWSGTALTLPQLASLNAAGGGSGQGNATQNGQLINTDLLNQILASVRRTFPTT